MKIGNMIQCASQTYYLAYKTIAEKHIDIENFYNDDVSIYIFPMVTLATLSCEIALKAQILFESEKERKGHDLVKLFNELSAEKRLEIINRTIDLFNYKSKACKSDDYLSQKSFYEMLEKHKLSFVECRYFYEKVYSIDMDFMEALMACLNDLDDEYKEYVLTQVTKKDSLKKDYINVNKQKNVGRMPIKIEDIFLWNYFMECQICGHNYTCSGSDIWDKRCPACQTN